MSTLNLEIPESQIVEWIATLPDESKKRILRSLIPSFDTLDSLVDRGEARIREIAKQRGVDWDALSEDQRVQLVDEIIHESE